MECHSRVFLWINGSLEHHLNQTTSILWLLAVSFPGCSGCIFVEDTLLPKKRKLHTHTHTHTHTHPGSFWRASVFPDKQKSSSQKEAGENVFETSFFRGMFNLRGVNQTLHKSPLGYELKMPVRVCHGPWIIQFLTSKFEYHTHMDIGKKKACSKESHFSKFPKASFLESFFWQLFQKAGMMMW